MTQIPGAKEVKLLGKKSLIAAWFTSMMKTCNLTAIGLKAKTGRAIAVVLCGPTDAPEFIKRTELVLTDPRVPATFQPYHEVMELPWNESQIRVKPFVRAIEKVAIKALAQLVHQLRSEDLEVVGVGIAGSADRDLSKIGSFHIRAHAAEGLLFRRVLEIAAQANNLPYRSLIEKSLQTEAASELNCTISKLNLFLTTLGRCAGPPWRADQRVAATAAWLSLETHERKSLSSLPISVRPPN
ncbi:MAG: hypothetical protein QOH96_3210 [Blastocatellia bacterium]|nr:hypothetical protein [Blastocatellia bacterium]